MLSISLHFRLLLLFIVFPFVIACSPESANNASNNNNYNDIEDSDDIAEDSSEDTNDTEDVQDIEDTHDISDSEDTDDNINNNNQNDPYVHIDAPQDGATVDNPAVFTFTARNVSTVAFYAEDWALSDPWTPSAEVDEFSYNFVGVGFVRHIKLEGYNSDGTPVAEHNIDITVVNSGIGDYLGTMYNTYYYLAVETEYTDADVTLYDASCNPLATVPGGFSDDVCVEGSGKLEEGPVIHYAGTCGSCSAAPVCPVGNVRICYELLDPASYPWGMGNHNNPLTPLRSWAVDNDLIPMGTLIYAAEWDGVYIPQVGDLGGFTHDGCFIADDTGGMIDGYHYDFFSGTSAMYQELNTNILPTYSDTEVYLNPPKCSYLEN